MKTTGLITALATALLIGPAQSANAVTMTADEEATVYNALIDQGVDATTAEQVASDPDQAQYVAVSGGYEQGGDGLQWVEPASSNSGAVISNGTATSNGGVTIEALGTCSGYSGYVYRNQSAYNVWGWLLVRITLRTDFCYNYSRVTYAHSTRTAYVSQYAAVGGWYFDKWTAFSEAWYTYNYHYYGGVKTETQGYFRMCTLKLGCVSSEFLTARTYAHYNGTWSTGGYTS